MRKKNTVTSGGIRTPCLQHQEIFNPESKELPLKSCPKQLHSSPWSPRSSVESLELASSFGSKCSESTVEFSCEISSTKSEILHQEQVLVSRVNERIHNVIRVNKIILNKYFRLHHLIKDL